MKSKNFSKRVCQKSDTILYSLPSNLATSIETEILI